MLALAGMELSGVGIYGVISFAAAQRMREMAVRLALGARGWRVEALIVGQGIRLAAIGILLGALARMWTASLLHARLYETSSTDPLPAGAAALLLLATATIACAVPALWASVSEYYA
jgi:ABC-type antimicrobial peptide transport system permease subunit